MRGACLILAVAFSMQAAWAVEPRVWQQSSEADFAEGEFDGTAVSSLGEVSLAPRVRVIFPADRAPQVVSALAVGDGSIYAASGADGVVYRIDRDESVTALAPVPATAVTSLLWTGRGLLAGASGKGAGVYRLNGQQQAELVWSCDDVASVWAMAEGPDGLYVATGDHAALYQISADGTARRVHQVDSELASNILCLAVGSDGCLYAGTDKSGLVLRIDPGTGDSRVILAAQENEVSALIPDLLGGLYVATSDAAKAAAEGDAQRRSSPVGRTEPATQTSQPADFEGKDKPLAEAEDSGPSQEADSAPEQQPEALDESEDDGIEQPPPVAPRMARPATGPAGRPPRPAARGGEGNAVYYVRPDGMVNTLFRREVTILSMLRRDDRLLLGTGNDGVIYSVNTDAEEVIRLADTSASQITALAEGPDDQVVFATANAGSVGALARAPSPQGTYTSPAHDAEQVARWGAIRVSSLGGGKLCVATRTGNTPEPKDNIWSPWSPPREAAGELMSIASPPGRFLQYRLELADESRQGPIVQHVEVVYQLANLAPVISRVQIEPMVQKRRDGADPEGPKPFRRIRIQAQDPNEDKLRYHLSLRQMGWAEWITLAEDLDEEEYVWDTRTVADGNYDLRVQASDGRSNPPDQALSTAQVHNFVTVDNTAPVFEPLLVDSQGSDVHVRAAVTDATSRIVELAYSVDSQEDWAPLAPVDHIADSPSEKVEFTVKDLEPGPHRIAVRAVDLLGNTGYGTAAVTIEP